jgi:hypothetical protein
MDGQLAERPLAPAPAAIMPDGTTNVTTTGGVLGYLPEFSGISTMVDSAVFVNGSNVGINTKSAAGTFQVNGSTILDATSLEGALKLNAVGFATSAIGEPSHDQFKLARTPSSQQRVRLLFALGCRLVSAVHLSGGALLPVG